MNVINNNSTNLHYQNHIDGLRALAVTIVWLFHMNPDLFPGGFIGVDIFFVISGYVITLSLLKNIDEKKNINLFLFYKKRFFRIFPVLFFIISITFVFYLFYGYLFELNYVSKISLSSLFGLSNILLIYLKSDYFLANEINPFLHTWSLGVEEQFYFCYPIILYILIYLLNKKILFFSKNFINYFFFFIIIFSFLLFIFKNETSLGNFYSPFARIWELLIGCLIFLLFREKKKNFNNLFLLTLFIILSFVIIDDNIINNNFVCISFAILFSSIIILCNTDKIIFLNILPIRYLGKISYSMYLWHLPILYFTQIYFNSFVFYPINIFAVLILSMLSYHIIEKNFRYSKFFQSIFLILLFIIFSIFLIILLSDKFIKNKQINNNYYNLKIEELKNTFNDLNYFEKKYNLSQRTEWNIILNDQNIINCENTHSLYHIEKKYEIDNRCLNKRNLENLIIINGDSHATHYYKMIENLSIEPSIYLKTYEGCLFIPELYAVGKIDYKNKFYKNFFNCQDYILNEKKVLKKLSANYKNVSLLISSRFTAYIEQSVLMDVNKRKFKSDEVYEFALKSLNQYVKELSNVKIILMAPLPEFQYYPYSCFLNKKLCYSDYLKDKTRIKSIKNLLQSVSMNNDNVYFFDPYEQICSIDKQSCTMYDIKKDLLFFKDTDHLTIEGSEYLSKSFEEFFLEKLQ